MKRKSEVVSIQQLQSEEAKKAFKEIQDLVKLQMRGAALSFIQGLFEQEMEEICGSPFSRKRENLAHRGGSDPGSVILEGQRVAVKKPRAKKEGEEVPLKTYTALQSFDLYCDRVMRHMLNGVSTRRYGKVIDEVSQSTGLSKSTVSKAFIRGSKQALEEINGRSLSEYEWVSILVDGIEFQGRHILVALGMTTKGEKLILGLREGSSENHEVCKDLFQNLIDRGLKTNLPFLFVLDGSKALKKAVRLVFKDEDKFPIQRCVRHKERNIIDYLPENHHGEFRRRWKLIHSMQSYAEAYREYQRLVDWLGRINEAAQTSLLEADEETLTVIQLKAPPMLRKTLLSTNPIESAFSKVRDITRRVKHWRSAPDQASRWAAASLQEAEKSFRLARGFKEIPAFMKTLKENSLPEKRKAA